MKKYFYLLCCLPLLVACENNEENAPEPTEETLSVIDAIPSLEYDELILVEGGTFVMGAQKADSTAYNYDSEAYPDEGPTHEVTLSSYYIGKYEITQALWKYVMSYDGAAADGTQLSPETLYYGEETPSTVYGEGELVPVYFVSYNDIINHFLPRLNAITGKIFRLPTEAEWEYAARGGNKSESYKYSGSNDIEAVAWYWDNSGDKAHEAGGKMPNALGLYDMSGNVWEWCSDVYEKNYDASAQENPKGPESGRLRVFRGGSWYRISESCRVSYRYDNAPDYRYRDLGFRLVHEQSIPE